MTSVAEQKSNAVESSPVPSNLQVFNTGKKGQADPNTVAIATVISLLGFERNAPITEYLKRNVTKLRKSFNPCDIKTVFFCYEQQPLFASNEFLNKFEFI